MRGWLIVLLLVPGAQALSVEATGPELPIVPGQAWPMDVVLTIECTEALLHPSLEPQITLAFQAPAGVSVAGDPVVPLERQACASGAPIQVNRTFQVMAGMDVPAEEPFAIAVAAAIDGSDVQAQGEVVAQTAFVSLFNATAPSTSKAAGPQKQISYDVTITNLGNARTKFSFKLVQIDGPGTVILPDQVVLDGVGGQTTAITAKVDFATPFNNGPNDEHTEFQMVVVSESVLKGTPGAQQPLAFAADTKGLYVPGLPLAVLAGVLLAMARRT